MWQYYQRRMATEFTKVVSNGLFPQWTLETTAANSKVSNHARIDGQRGGVVKIMKLMRWPYHPSCAQLCIVQQTLFWPFSLMITNFPSLLYSFTECITDSCLIPLSAWGFSSSPWYFPCFKCSWLIHVYLAKPAFLSLPVSAEWWSVDDLFWISNWRLKLDTSAVREGSCCWFLTDWLLVMA